MYFSLTIMIDVWRQESFRKPDSHQGTQYPVYLQPDQDVASETNRVIAQQNSDAPVQVKHLNKTYGSGFVAVNDVTFDVKPNEVMGLLGPNGAGKSTTFNVLTFDIKKSSGDVVVNG